MDTRICQYPCVTQSLCYADGVLLNVIDLNNYVISCVKTARYVQFFCNMLIHTFISYHHIILHLLYHTYRTHIIHLIFYIIIHVLLYNYFQAYSAHTEELYIPTHGDMILIHTRRMKEKLVIFL